MYVCVCDIDIDIGIDVYIYTGVRSENIVMCKIAHFCTFLGVILTNFVRDF